ncbi:expressed unknown protein [Seminavis robusta]|uniref:Aldehyde dehydrogenase domain-containing protein n=1 Tax=Seminavis robusta TaxID=568900 RepID=A0A9N8D771_9STRA|nr:expressed unknown protein [Seminavis robusta]|eukprot:Sro18_g013150.1 n/a (761) ;mRNA; f:164835-167349
MMRSSVVQRMLGRAVASSHGNISTTTSTSTISVVPTMSVMSSTNRQFHFGSTDYSRTFRNLPKPDIEALRNSSTEYLQSFDPKLWYDEPITSLLNGSKLPGTTGTKVDTTDAFGNVNGSQYLATPEQVAQLKQHIATYTAKANNSNNNNTTTITKDLRQPLRKIEHALLTEHTGFLIGNQCLDFGKQDGITELEESIMANTVEQRLNDLVLSQEQQGKIYIQRQPIYVSCVSNFTNFLDLFRKTIRSIEVGIPAVILGRSNTQQHAYRWTLLLAELLAQEGVDPGMLTFLSCSLDDIKDITQSCPAGNLYATCSRALAADMMAGYPKTVASTGGPNTLVTTEWNEKVAAAVQISASIECAGQCTALRHVVAPPTVDDASIKQVFDGIKEIPTPQFAVENALFDGVFRDHQGSVAPSNDDSYTHHDKVDAYFRVGDEPPVTGDDDLPEYWRKVVVDFSKMDLSKPNIDKLAAWLNKHQPISLAINGPRDQVFELGVQLFDKTGMVVYTIGSTDDEEHPPALTCQARPQEAEVFGEFPPRSRLTEYTRYPVVVPSSTPSYDAEYSKDYLTSLAVDEFFNKSSKALLEDIQDGATRGFCVEVIRYLQDATMKNPKMGFGTSRTALWGLQRPPIGTKTWIRCGVNASWDDLAPVYMLFHTTNAQEQVELSIDPANDSIEALCIKHGLAYTSETEESFSSKEYQPGELFNIVPVRGGESSGSFPMAGQFVSLYFPLGHIKSTMPKDHEFSTKLDQLSNKWLTTLF